MAETILDKIVARKRLRIADAKARVPQAEIERRAARTPVPEPLAVRFETVASAPRSDRRPVLAEIKKASPSKGIFREDFDPARIAASYAAAGASGLSVLTEEDFFLGHPDFLGQAAQASGLPCLRKDFMIDPYQIPEARALGASAVLLIVSILSDTEIREFSKLAASFSLDALVEVHDAAELDRALACGCRFLGINNRDLKTFSTDIAVTEKLLPKIPKNARVLSESGLGSGAELDRLAAQGAGGFLIGETFMRQADPGEGLRRLLSECRPPAQRAAH